MKKIVKVVALLSIAAAVMMGCKQPTGGNTDDPTGGNTTGGNTTGGSTTDSDTPAPGGDKDGGLTLGGEDDTETDATGTVWTKQLVSGGWHVTGSGKLPALITSSGAQYEECYIVKDGDYSAYTSFKVTFEEFGDNASELQFKVIEEGDEEYIPIGKD